MNVLLRILLASMLTISVWAQAPPSRLPRFEDYAVAERFKGRPALPKIVSPDDRYFRTMIRQGAAKGPNFAGHYTIAAWGCGSSCVSIALVDAKDGTLFKVPFNILGWGMLLQYDGQNTSNRDGFEPLSYRVDSRLLVVRGCPEDDNCAAYFYEWKESQFKLIRKIVAVPVRH